MPREWDLGMTLYWIYDLPNWQLGFLVVAVFLAGSIAGLLLTRPLTRRLLEGSSEHNEVVNFFFTAVGVLYGLAMGLIAVATWENFSTADDQISKEAAALAGLYRDLDGYPQPIREQLEQKLRAYVRFIIEQDWPAHREGKVNPEGTRMLDRFENDVMAFKPTDERDKISHSEVVRDLNEVVDLRDLRLHAVGTGLPAAVWYIVLVGALLTIVLTYLFWIEHLRLHILLVGLLSTIIALLIFLTAAMDNPFRGEFSVNPDAYREVLDTVMVPESAPPAPTR